MQAAVTAWAWRTPLGDVVDVAIDRLLAGERAARPGVRFPTNHYRCQLCAPVLSAPKQSRHRRFLRRMALLGVEVGCEAFHSSGALAGERLGLFAAVGGLYANWDELMPAMALQEPDGRATWERGFKRLHPFWMLQYLSNNAHALLAADVQALGDGATFAGASGGAQALGAAIRSLHAGVIDAAVVVAYGSLAEPETLVELADAAAVSQGGLAALRAPYAGDADGFVPGEAAVALVLERPATAGKRTRALVSATDGGDGERGQPRSETFTRVVASVAFGAEVVDGAARARPTLDGDERVGLATLLPDGTPLMASSAAMGEIGSAKPLAQVIVLAECLRRGVLPPIAGLRAPALGPLRPLTSLVQTRARVAIGVVTGAPGLVGTVRVELP